MYNKEWILKKGNIPVRTLPALAYFHWHSEQLVEILRKEMKSIVCYDYFEGFNEIITFEDNLAKMPFL